MIADTAAVRALYALSLYGSYGSLCGSYGSSCDSCEKSYDLETRPERAT